MPTTINIGGECQGQPPAPTTPGTYYLKAWYTGPVDAGHVSGPFGTRESAEKAMAAMLHRDNVIRVLLTTSEE